MTVSFHVPNLYECGLWMVCWKRKDCKSAFSSTLCDQQEQFFRRWSEREQNLLEREISFHKGYLTVRSLLAVTLAHALRYVMVTVKELCKKNLISSKPLLGGHFFSKRAHWVIRDAFKCLPSNYRIHQSSWRKLVSHFNSATSRYMVMKWVVMSG